MLIKQFGLKLKPDRYVDYVAIAAVVVFYTWFVLICDSGEDFWALNSVSSLKKTENTLETHQNLDFRSNKQILLDCNCE